MTATIAYASCPATYIVGTPTKIVVTATGVELRHREADVNCATGNVTQVREYLANDQRAVTDLAYNPSGNLARSPGRRTATRRPALHARLRVRYGCRRPHHRRQRQLRLHVLGDARLPLRPAAVDDRQQRQHDQLHLRRLRPRDQHHRPVRAGHRHGHDRLRVPPRGRVPYALTRHLDALPRR